MQCSTFPLHRADPYGITYRKHGLYEESWMYNFKLNLFSLDWFHMRASSSFDLWVRGKCYRRDLNQWNTDTPSSTHNTGQPHS